MDFIQVPSNPVPDGGTVEALNAPDGAVLRAAYFPVENARGCVVLQAGRCEYLEKYFEVIEELRSRKFNVATMDWRGQGLSARMLPDTQKGHIDDFSTFKDDLKVFMDEHVKARMPGPYFLMTHSMGGMPALMLLADGYDAFERAILCAPMTKFQLTPSMQKYTKFASNVACKFGMSRTSVFGVKEHSLEFEGNHLTSDERRHARFLDIQRANPDACILAPTYGWVHAGVKAITAIHEEGALANIKCPVLIISAERDFLVSTDDHVDLARQYPMIEQVTIEGALHEVMMERDEFRAQYWDAVDKFMSTD